MPHSQADVILADAAFTALRDRLLRAAQSQTDSGLAQSDIAKEIFDAWYAHASQYAKSGYVEVPDSDTHSSMRCATRDALSCLLGMRSEDGCGNGETGNDQEPFMCGSNLDMYAARSLLEHASQILTLHQTKPKFKNLLIGLPGQKNGMTHNNFLYWIERVFCGELNRVVMHHNAPDSTRTQALSTLMVVQELSESLLRVSGSDVFKAGLPIKLDPRNYAGLAVQPRIAGAVRDATSELLTAIFRNVPHHQDAHDTGSAVPASAFWRSQIAQVIASKGLDDKAFTLGWRLGMLDVRSALDHLIARIKAEAKRHQSTSRNESMSLSGNASPLVSAVLSSIYEISMNWRNEDVQELGNKGKSTSDSNNGNDSELLPSHISRGDFVFDVDSHASDMAHVLRVCDFAAKSLYQERESVHAEKERSQQFLEALGALLETYPDSGDLLDLILNPLTLEGLSTVAGISGRFSAETWTKWLLPFIMRQMNKMSLRGISGRQVEQETIDLLRDCARHFYLGEYRCSSIRTSAFGEQLYRCIIEAIRHGYIETEGFPRIAAIVVARHLGEGKQETDFSENGSNTAAGYDQRKESKTNNHIHDTVHMAHATNLKHSALDWIRFALTDKVCHSLKTMRAMHEIILTLLGLESSSGIGFDFDATTKGYSVNTISKRDHEEVVLSVTTCGTTHDAIACLSLWSVLCTSYPVFVTQHEFVVTQLLLTIREDLDRSLQQRGCTVEWWAAAMRMLCALAGCITESNAPLLFDQVLKVTAICPAGEASSLAAHCGDSTIASIVDKISVSNSMDGIAVPISQPAIFECIRRAGVLTRQSLARIVPGMLLLDLDARVRTAALVAMEKQPTDALLNASGAVFGACLFNSSQKAAANENDGSTSIQLYDIDVAIACAPVVARLAVCDKTGSCIVPAIERLVWAARVTAEGSHLGETHEAVLKALSFISVNLDPTTIERFCVSADGQPWLGPLRAISSNWKAIVDSLVDEGKIMRTKGKKNRIMKRRKSHDSQCFELAGDQGNEALPVCNVIRIEDAPAIDAAKTYDSALTVVEGTLAEVSSAKGAKDLGAPARVVPAGESSTTSWATLNEVRDEGQWNWETGDRSTDLYASKSDPIDPGQMTAFDFSRLPEVPTHSPKPGYGSKEEELDGGRGVLVTEGKVPVLSK
eukprot:g2143.t1